jgi:hypothetical protein
MQCALEYLLCHNWARKAYFSKLDPTFNVTIRIVYMVWACVIGLYVGVPHWLHLCCDPTTVSLCLFVEAG